jgi:hypothetical protein
MEKIRTEILELCAEDAYGSWEFWENAQNKIEEEARLITEALCSLVANKLVEPCEHKAGGDYLPVSLNPERLLNEVTLSMSKNKISPDNFYWFTATELGKQQDIRNRSVPKKDL